MLETGRYKRLDACGHASRGKKGMKIGIPKEVQDGETRVALVPNLISLLAVRL